MTGDAGGGRQGFFSAERYVEDNLVGEVGIERRLRPMIGEELPHRLLPYGLCLLLLHAVGG
jgi:hypothetical protein